MSGVTPVFVLNNQLPAFDQKFVTTAEICSAVEITSGYDSIEGAQRIGGLWRIYPRSQEARHKLLLQGFTIRKVRVEVKNTNPFLVSTPDGKEKEIMATKLIINNVPLSFSDEEIVKSVKQLKVSIRSKIIDERDRDSNGKLTRWKTGRRFLYIDVPTEPLPKLLEMGPFKASLFHKEQKHLDSECGKCLRKGHRTAACDNPVKCRQCFKDGHKAGDPHCDMTPANQPENSNSYGGKEDTNDSKKSPDRKSPDCNSASKTPVCASSSKSSISHSNGNNSTRNSSSTNPRKSPVHPKPVGRGDDTPDAVKPKEQSRGRPARRENHSGSKGQTTLNFHRETSRSNSTKRPGSKDKTPPQLSKEKTSTA
eukprot:TRINITY_DN26057_c0_g1_i5.p1 TRINITY_DN26057_c0_g1~~TRINITY_DN26057_c0_g1_i5.p1  ORF type:complete len:366 (+),score=55.96 TRINITY_DN26057_c0_g1_i5:150-1247(+)